MKHYCNVASPVSTGIHFFLPAYEQRKLRDVSNIQMRCAFRLSSLETETKSCPFLNYFFYLFRKTTELSDAVLTMSHYGTNGALIQLSSGELLEYQDGNLSPRLSLPEPCVSVRAVKEHVFSRAHNNHLYVDEELIANNASSYFCLPDFLIMTLTTHQLCVTTADSDFKVGRTLK